MAEVSRNLVAILLVLVIVVSAIGTWSLFGSQPKVEYVTEYPGAQTGAGYVSLTLPRTDSESAAIQLSIAEDSSGQ